MKLYHRPLRIFMFTDDVEALEKESLQYMAGQCQLVLEILRKRNGPWTSELLAECMVKEGYTGETQPMRAANYFIFRLKKAGTLTFYRTWREYETTVAIRNTQRAES